MSTRLLMHHERPEALVSRRDGALERVALDAPAPLARLEAHADGPWLLCAGTSIHSAQPLVGVGADAIDLLDWDSLEPLARMKLGRSCSTWSAMAHSAHSEWLAAADSSGTVHLLDRARARHHVSQLDGMRARSLAIDPQGRWAAGLLSDPNRGALRLWRLDDAPRVHVRRLDLRHAHTPAPELAAARGCVAFDASGELVFSYFSTSSRLTHYPDGWRGSVTAHETQSGRLVWSSEIDGQLTGDWRPLDDLDLPGGALDSELALTDHGHALAVGTSRGTIVLLDPRDGALRSTHHTGSPHPITHLAHACDQTLWSLTSLGALLPAH